MNTKLAIVYKNIAVVVLFVLAIACEPLDLAPENKFTDANYWTSTEKAQMVLNKAYNQMFNSAYFFYNEALSDNALNGRGDNAGAASIAAGTYDASLNRMKEEWGNRYEGIKTCNIFLENIDRVPNMDAEVKNQMIAEARFLRAWQHFQLMTWFGDIPLLDRDITIEEAQTIARTPRAQVLSFITVELEAAAENLPLNTAYTADEQGKITKGAAIALLARVYLYESDWTKVISYCERIIDGQVGSYSLLSSYSGLFLPENEYSSEDILSLQFVPEDRTWSEFFDMAPISAGARLNALAPTQELVDSYIMLNGETINSTTSGYDENNPYVNRDPRLTATVVYHNYQWENPDGTTHTIYIMPGSDPSSDAADEYASGSSKTATGYYTRKYFDPTHTSGLNSGLNLMLIRYADVLLMYAEAKFESGEFTETVWDNTIKLLRERAGFTNAAALNYDSSLSSTALQTVIRNERRSELAMEGLRIFDIRRWKTAEDVLNGWVHGAKFDPASPDNGYIRVSSRTFDPNKHYLWPIPRDERLINDNLTQNPGWQ